MEPSRSPGLALALVAGIGGTIGFAACGTPPAPKPVPAPATASATASAAPLASTSASDAGTGSDAAAMPSATASAVASATPPAVNERCEAPGTKLVDPPGEGAVFNNAMTAADAGSLDRTRAVLDVLIGQSKAFRCCLDAAAGPREGHAMIVVSLEADGAVKAARVDPRRSNVRGDGAIGCIERVAGAGRYPASPASRSTVVEFPLRFAKSASGKSDKTK